jgi:hypothetical protein
LAKYTQENKSEYIKRTFRAEMEAPFMMLTVVLSGAKNLFLIFFPTNPEINLILMMA